MLRTGSFCCALIVGSATLSGAQGASSSVTLTGRVIAADTGLGLRNVRIDLSASEPGDGTPAQVFTGADGRYEITGVRDGRYRLRATKDGFVALALGESRPGGGGRILRISGKSLDRLDIALPRGGVITGRIIDSFGEPIAGVQVQVHQVRYTGGRPSLGPASLAMSDENGEYRAFGLQPGVYSVSAEKRVPLPYGPSVRPGTVPGQEFGFDRIFFPEAKQLAQAELITMSAGTLRGGIDLILSTVQMSSIRGKALGLDGAPLGRARVELYAPERLLPFATISTIDASGDFTITGVPPGNYQVRAKGENGAATASVVATGGTVIDVTLRPIRLPTLSGRIVIDPEERSQLPIAAIRVGVQPSEPPSSRLAEIWRPSPVALDGTMAFALPALPGRWAPAVELPTGWMVKAIRLRGSDITDTGIGISEGEAITDLEIELTKRHPTVTGTVRTQSATAPGDYAVLLFARDTSRRLGDRYFAVLKPDQDGLFSATSVAAGEYYVVALSGVDVNLAQEPTLLDRLSRVASPLVLNWGQAVQVTLPLTD